MRNNIIALAAVFFISIGAIAQIDRSKQPEPGPAPKVNIGKPQSFVLENGLKVLVVENHKLPRVSVSLNIDNEPYAHGEKAGVSGLTGALLGEGSKNIPKDEFNEEVDYLGARLNFGASGASANTLSKYFPRIMKLMAEGALNPNFTQEEFEKEKERTLEGMKTNEKDVAYNARRVRSALAYGKDHPYGEFSTTESVEGLNLADVQNHYDTYFAPQNAYLVVVGDVEFENVVELVTENFSNWEKKNLPTNNVPEVSNPGNTQVNFIDMPNAVQSEVAVLNTINLTKNDDDYFPVIVANKILGGGGEARLFLNLREDKGYTYGAYSSTGDDKYASTFVASASVRNAVTDSAVVAFLDEIHRIRNEKVSPEELENAKNKYTGDFVLSLEQPSTIARFALTVETDDLSEDFYENYLEKIKAVTAEDIQRVAQKYFLVDNARIVVVGKGSEVAEKLENLTYNGEDISVKYFDKYGNETEKTAKKELDKDLTANEVFQKHLDAIGGKDAVEAMNTVYVTAQADIQGQKLNMEMKNTKDNKTFISVGMNGMVMSKQVYNGEEGFIEQQGQKTPYTEEQKATAESNITPFTELNAENATLDRIDDVDGTSAYVVKMGENNELFYDVETGLRVKSVTTMSQGGQSMSIPTVYSDYQEVDGVKFPFTISQSMGPQSFDFKVSSVQINEGVSNADFEE